MKRVCCPLIFLLFRQKHHLQSTPKSVTQKCPPHLSALLFWPGISRTLAFEVFETIWCLSIQMICLFLALRLLSSSSFSSPTSLQRFSPLAQPHPQLPSEQLPSEWILEVSLEKPKPSKNFAEAFVLLIFPQPEKRTAKVTSIPKTCFATAVNREASKRKKTKKNKKMKTQNIQKTKKKSNGPKRPRYRSPGLVGLYGSHRHHRGDGFPDGLSTSGGGAFLERWRQQNLGKKRKKTKICGWYRYYPRFLLKKTSTFEMAAILGGGVQDSRLQRVPGPQGRDAFWWVLCT